MPNTFAACTLGCKVAQYETEAIAEAFLRAGFVRGTMNDACDVYVVNTCTVTAEADRKCRQTIRRAVRRNPRGIVLVTGCYAQTTPGDLAKIPGVTYVCGTAGKMRLPEVARAQLARRPASPLVAVSSLAGAAFEPMTVESAPRTRAYVKIEDGCDCFCTYCAIPYARGPVRSKAPGDVLAEVEGLAASGTREVVLTGIEIASYGLDLPDCRLIDLLEKLDRESSIPRIRLGSLTPELMREPFISRLAKLTKIAPHFHLSMQSGSADVLKRMRRRYNPEQALDAMQQLRAAIRGVTFTTDLMVGFPGETEEHFNETLAFAKDANFLDMHVFAYSRRRGTEADRMPDQVPEDVKHRRSAELIAAGKTMRRRHFAAVLAAAEPLSVLFETREMRDGRSYWVGHSDRFFPIRAAYDGDMHGKLALVIPTGSSGDVLTGAILPETIR